MSHAQRRQKLLAALKTPALLFSGGQISRNYPANPFPYRADSNFLYFFERPEPGSAAFFDPADQSVTLFLPERSVESALWEGAVPSFEEEKARHGVTQILPVEKLEDEIRRLSKGRQIDGLAVADFRTTSRARAITGEDLDFDDPSKLARPALVDAIAQLRLFKDEDELKIMRHTAEVTKEGHLLAMRYTRPGVTEQLLTGHLEGAFARHGCVPAYGTILSVRGEVLHNHAHHNVLQKGDIVLTDAGAEDEATGYCSDVTRCWPVGGFTSEGKEIYELVLKSEIAAIDAVKPKARYRDVHLTACRVLAQGLKDLGLLKGSVDTLVETGAHACFFPHGVGHQLGLDVHDFESFGDRIHYPGGRTRSEQFGLCYLRMDMDLAEGMTFTIEPGLYFVPEIINSPKFREQHKDTVLWDRAEKYLSMNGGRGFGGIRIEDDVLCTKTGPEVLTKGIPKAADEVEKLVSAA